jgi:hypothetical protein
MVKLNYKTKIYVPESAYVDLYKFIAPKIAKLDMDWNGLVHKGTIFYLDDLCTKAVRISPKRFFGLLNRKVELTDRVEEEIVMSINKIKEDLNNKAREL